MLTIRVLCLKMYQTYYLKMQWAFSWHTTTDPHPHPSLYVCVHMHTQILPSPQPHPHSPPPPSICPKLASTNTHSKLLTSHPPSATHVPITPPYALKKNDPKFPDFVVTLYIEYLYVVGWGVGGSFGEGNNCIQIPGQKISIRSA